MWHLVEHLLPARSPAPGLQIVQDPILRQLSRSQSRLLRRRCCCEPRQPSAAVGRPSPAPVPMACEELLLLRRKQLNRLPDEGVALKRLAVGWSAEMRLMALLELSSTKTKTRGGPANDQMVGLLGLRPLHLALTQFLWLKAVAAPGPCPWRLQWSLARRCRVCALSTRRAARLHVLFVSSPVLPSDFGCVGVRERSTGARGATVY